MILKQKEKAKELFNKYLEYTDNWASVQKGALVSAQAIYQTGRKETYAKKCALITVNEILENDMINRSTWQVTYWQEVKQEIEKL